MQVAAIHALLPLGILVKPNEPGMFDFGCRCYLTESGVHLIVRATGLPAPRWEPDTVIVTPEGVSRIGNDAIVATVTLPEEAVAKLLAIAA